MGCTCKKDGCINRDSSVQCQCTEWMKVHINEPSHLVTARAFIQKCVRKKAHSSQWVLYKWSQEDRKTHIFCMLWLDFNFPNHSTHCSHMLAHNFLLSGKSAGLIYPEAQWHTFIVAYYLVAALFYIKYASLFVLLVCSCCCYLYPCTHHYHVFIYLSTSAAFESSAKQHHWAMGDEVNLSTDPEHQRLWQA